MHLPSSLLERYKRALHAYCIERGDSSIKTAYNLGSEALAMKLGALDLAKLHEQALASLIHAKTTPEEKSAIATRATRFFKASVAVIADTPGTVVSLRAVTGSLDQTLSDLAEAKKNVKLQHAERRVAEVALAASEVAAQSLLAESLQLEIHLKVTARKILMANEDERKRMSLKLQDEIAQTLLGIHIRLLALQSEVSANNVAIVKEISATQRLVEKSAETIRQYSRQLGLTHDS